VWLIVAFSIVPGPEQFHPTIHHDTRPSIMTPCRYTHRLQWKNESLKFLKGGISGALFKEAFCREAFRAAGLRLATILVFAMRHDNRNGNGNAARRHGEAKQKAKKMVRRQK
jgi:hypothetical protein